MATNGLTIAKVIALGVGAYYSGLLEAIAQCN
jgi:hypothetical protein